jgi:hypothetical protein
MLRLVFTVGTILSTPALAHAAPVIATIDYPGKNNGSLAVGINAAGTVVGTYFTYLHNVPRYHGFIRAADGTFTSFNVPGENLAVPPRGSYLGTVPMCINDQGVVAGYYWDGAKTHGFVRAANGTITKFNPTMNLEPLGINDGGIIVGSLAPNGRYGFERLADGKFVKLTAGSLGTAITPFAVNGGGTVVGEVARAGKFVGGFIRRPDGTTRPLNIPHATGTSPLGINENGAITGTYYTGTHLDIDLRLHGFTRTSDGTIRTFDPPGAIYTDPIGINDAGWVTGSYTTEFANTPYHGFVRTPAGKITSFDPPLAETTYPQSINAHGVIAGYYYDADSKPHAFMRTAP